ncbi:hypothetical protein [Pseudomonas hunanensis]|uniref:hypothetical protein n=1 Tax=Pseudomonas hunanensis TaxID=1247546 RepID=UPI0024054E36|nr:hypothetical protein [Pseudomonas hunanensis]MDF9754821.1 hypothetical protein [Pseudomonas hunanensis]
MQAAKELDQVTNVSFLFGIAKVQAEAPPDYARQHLLRYLAEYGEQGVDEERLQQMTRLMAAIPLTSADTLPTLRDSVLRQHAARTACIRQAVERQTPLLEGETLLEESFAFLGKPYNGCRVRSVALLRTTNYGQLVYLFKDVVVGQDGQLLFIEAVGPVSSPAADLELSSTDVVAAAFGELGGKLATSLASAVGGAIGKALFEQAFPPGVPSYFDQVYVELKRIVGGELQQSLIDSIDGSIKSIQQHLETEYLPAKESLDLTLLEDRKQLFALLQKYETTYPLRPGRDAGHADEREVRQARFRRVPDCRRCATGVVPGDGFCRSERPGTRWHASQPAAVQLWPAQDRHGCQGREDVRRVRRRAVAADHQGP